MKRKVLCVFALIAYLLIFCTGLAPSIQREMRTQVEIKHIAGEKVWRRNIAVANTAIRFQETRDKLFQILPGSGWEKGDRIREVSPSAYTVSHVSDVELHPGKNYDLVIAASRQPVEGDLVEIVESFQVVEDTYLICCPGREELYTPPASFQVIQNEYAGALASFSKGKLPFFEYRYTSVLEKMHGERIFSMTEVEQFLLQMPKVMGFLVALLLGIFLWAHTCRQSRKIGRSWMVWKNIGLIGALLVTVPLVARTVDLPASLMPKDHIFNIGHYSREFSSIFSTLEQMGSNILDGAMLRMYLSCGAVLLLGIGIAVTTVILDRKFAMKREKTSA